MKVVESASDFQTEFRVSRETVSRLQALVETLVRWQRAINLVSPTTVSDVWSRHIADSAQLVGLVDLKGVKTWLDLGSGGGFPGLVIAAMLADFDVERRVVLVESDARKCAFLREASRKMGLGPSVAVDIVAERIESPSVFTKVGKVDVVSARALSSLDRLLELSSPFCGPNTVGVYPKGRDAAAEVAKAEFGWDFDGSFVPSLTDRDASVVVVRELKRRIS